WIRVAHPLAWDEVVTRPRVLERPLTVERHTAPGRLVETGVHIARRCREVDLHMADRVDDLPEALEVDRQEVLDRNSQVLAELFDRERGPAVGERGIELVAAVALDGDLGVA